MSKVITVFKALWAILTRREFAHLLTSLDYVQLYNDKYDVVFVLGRNPPPLKEDAQNPSPPEKEEQEAIQTAQKCIRALRQVAQGGILQKHNNTLTLYIPVGEKEKKELKETLKA